MRRVVLSVAMSLDGYIADPQGGYDWIVMDPEIDFDAMFKRHDAVLMGRKSYDAAKQSGYGMSKPETYVFSKTLQQADAPDVTVSNDPRRTVTALKKQKGKDIMAVGWRRAVPQPARAGPRRSARGRNHSGVAGGRAPAAAEVAHAREAHADGRETIQEDGDIDADLRGEAIEETNDFVGDQHASTIA